MTAPEPSFDLMSADAWPAGVGGAQCDECGETTIVKAFGDYASDDPLDEAVHWLCLPCWRGDDDTFYDPEAS